MPKKLDLRGKNASRNAAGKETIQNSVAFQAVVEKTEKAIASKKTVKVSETPEIDAVIGKIVGKQIGEYKRVPISNLVSAPPEWNYFSPLSEEKKVMMAESIFHNGLLQPIIVRQIDENKYEILAGHHRTEAYNVLRIVTGDSKYDEIEARVFPSNSLTDDQAREIVEDTNFIQRGNLSARDKAACIQNKAKRLRDSGVRGDIMTKVAEHFGLSRATAFFWKKLTTLIPEFWDEFSAGRLGLLTAGKIAGFSEDIQKELYINKDLITNESMARVRIEDDLPTILAKLKGAFNIPVARISSLKEQKDKTFLIKVDRAPKDEDIPVLLYMPEKKLKSLKKKYGDYIIQKEE